jgi:hypothetical protein
MNEKNVKHKLETISFSSPPSYYLSAVGKVLKGIINTFKNGKIKYKENNSPGMNILWPQLNNLKF